jgi:hypothetical protein
VRLHVGAEAGDVQVQAFGQHGQVLRVRHLALLLEQQAVHGPGPALHGSGLGRFGFEIGEFHRINFLYKKSSIGRRPARRCATVTRSAARPATPCGRPLCPTDFINLMESNMPNEDIKQGQPAQGAYPNERRKQERGAAASGNLDASARQRALLVRGIGGAAAALARTGNGR